MKSKREYWQSQGGKRDAKIHHWEYKNTGKFLKWFSLLQFVEEKQKWPSVSPGDYALLLAHVTCFLCMACVKRNKPSFLLHRPADIFALRSTPGRHTGFSLVTIFNFHPSFCLKAGSWGQAPLLSQKAAQQNLKSLCPVFEHSGGSVCSTACQETRKEPHWGERVTELLRLQKNKKIIDPSHYAH